ncbi:MAG: flagellar filament capping protein FliD [Candidatus Latescibacterota bacterium]|nr:flagellar filament capping protein FliD [Candidatus Latescibacterota bacterium]
MSQGISFSGLGSGLDTDGIINQLMDIERRPISRILQRQETLKQQRGVLGSINSSLQTLQTSAEGLASDSAFSIVSARSEDSQRISVDATNEAAAGSFSVEVLELATARSLSSRSFADLSQSLDLNGGFVVNGKGINITAEDSLLDLRDKVNDAEAGVTAQLLTVSTGDSRLILTADDVGSDGFSIQDASTTNVLQDLGLTSSATSIKNSFYNGARGRHFLNDSDAIGSLLGLSTPPSGTVKINGNEIQIDLSTDSLNSIQAKIEASVDDGVNATVITSEVNGIERSQLVIEGTTSFVDDGGIFENLGVLQEGGALSDPVASGAESDAFLSTSSTLGALLGLDAVPSGTVQISGAEIDINLIEDTLVDVQNKINNAAIDGVTASIVISDVNSESDDDSARFRLRIEGATDLNDDGNVLESLGILVGSNSGFESVSQVVTSNVNLMENGDLVNPTSNGAVSSSFALDTDSIGELNGSTVSGNVQIAGVSVSLDLATDSLNDIRDKINAANIDGVVAKVNAIGPSKYALEISGSTDIHDGDDVFSILGIVESASSITAETRFVDILSSGVKAGDTISISGLNNAGDQVFGTFTIASNTVKVENLLNSIEQTFGNSVIASVDEGGRIIVRDESSGSSSLALSLEANNEGGGALSLGEMARTTTGVDSRSAELQAGQDAIFRVNGIELGRSSNTVTDAVQGVTLELNQAEKGKLISISVEKDDTSALKDNITSFVDQFNTSLGLINEQLAYDKESETSGPLSGDSTLLSLQSRLRSIVSRQIDGLDDGFNAMVLIGINFDRSGQLEVDEEQLEKVLTENLEEVRKLFVAQGSASDRSVDFVSSNSDTMAGNYSVSISQAASQATVRGDSDFTGSLAEDKTLRIIDKVTGKPAEIVLRAGSTLNDVVSQINTSLSSDVAEVRRGNIGNTTNGATAITEGTVFADILGADVKEGDTIRIDATEHGGNRVSKVFTVDDPASDTVGDLLSEIRASYGGQVSVNIDAEGRIMVTDNRLGDSDLTLTLVEDNQGGGSLNFGSIDVETEGRLALTIKASSNEDRLTIEHGNYGSHNGFSIESDLVEFGISAANFEGLDVQGQINGHDSDGSGRILTGPTGTENIDGLSLRVNIDAEDLTTEGPDQGNISLIFGVGRLLSDELKAMTDVYDGTIKTREDAITDTLDSLDKRIEEFERRVEQKRLMLVGRFASLEGSIANLQSQGNFLSSQLARLG